MFVTHQITATSDNFPPAVLWAHGTGDVRNEGNIVIYQAYGPFNLEFVQAMSSLRASIQSELVALGAWGEIIVINDSAYATMDALTAYTKHLEGVNRLDIKSSYTAFVIGPEVEGRKLMAPLLVNCYAALDRTPPVFECLHDARRWIEGKLSEKGIKGAE